MRYDILIVPENERELKRALERERREREREERGNENCEIHAFKVLFKEEQFDSTQNYINFNLRYS